MNTMRLFAVLLMSLVLAACAPFKMLEGPSDPVAGKLRLDGVYQGPQESSRGYTYWPYFRFFADGSLKNSTNIGGPQGVFKLLGSDASTIASGKVTIRGNRISFSSTGDGVTVDYLGTITADSLTLDTYSHSNGNRAQSRVYKFIPVAP